MTITADLVVADGTVVNADGRQSAHVVIQDGQVREIVDAASPTPAARRVISAAGRLVIPGGVDAHCHIAQVTGRYRTLDDYAITSTAALWGGTTTLIDFGIPRDATETPLAAAQNKLRLAEISRCDIALHGSVITWDDTVPAQLEQLAAMGICSVKVYTTNRGTTMADESTILNVMHEMAGRGGLTYIHAEHDAMIVDCTRRHAEHGHTGAQDLHHTRPTLAEEVSVREMLGMAEYAGAAVYFVHQTTPIATDLVTDARQRGLTAYSETCPHYVALDDSAYDGKLPEWYSCCPPLRDPHTVAQLRTRLATGQVDTVASDHSCYDTRQKGEHVDQIGMMPQGLPGVETRMPATFTTMVRDLGLPVERFVEVFASTPARINDLPRKGVLAPGYDADIVVFDPGDERGVDNATLHMGTDYSPFDGARLVGWPETVISNGRVVLDMQQFHDPGPVGRFIPRTPVLRGDGTSAA